MEYLTLQDIPHRYCDQMHSQRMSLSHPAERPLAHMAAAVSEAHDSSRSLPLLSSSLSPPTTSLLCTQRPPSGQTGSNDDNRKHAWDDLHDENMPVPSPAHIRLPPLPLSQITPDRRASLYDPARPGVFHDEQLRRKHQDSISARSLELSRLNISLPALKNTTSPSEADTSATQQLDSPLTKKQQHHMRSSPPIQPGEQHHAAKLPSFSEVSYPHAQVNHPVSYRMQFLHTTRSETPPRTPSYRNGSVGDSPRARPLFDEVAWDDDNNKRRRTDTLGDIFTANSGTANHHMANPRRMSSAIDPSLAGYGSPRPSQHATMHSAAPSHSYLPSQNASHQSSPHAANHVMYPHQQTPRHSITSQSPFGHPPPQHDLFEHRQSYYAAEGQPDHPFRGPTYQGAPHPGYDNSYGEFRFQPHVGNDHGTFNRKRRGNLPKEATNILKEWFESNRASPYPTEDQKVNLCIKCHLTMNQVCTHAFPATHATSVRPSFSVI